MAACFKLPTLAKRPKPPSQFPEFKWSEVKIEAELGCGTFGSVDLVKYDREDRGNVIVKNMKGESAEAKRRFEKETGILSRYFLRILPCKPLLHQGNLPFLPTKFVQNTIRFTTVSSS